MLTFKDLQTGKEMQYNLYTPKNLEPGRKYPLVMFIADASTAGKGVKAPLMQGTAALFGQPTKRRQNTLPSCLCCLTPKRR